MDVNVIPGYAIKKKLGEGAMAKVYLAKEAKLNRNVALKVMARKFLSDPSFADRFLREARIVASISHRNIVTVFDVGSHDDYHYLAMELLPGGDLNKKLKKGLPLEEAISHVKDVAAGLQYASSKNFIHRDIKPDNIMFGEDGRAVITDFGIARNTASETNMTMVGSIIGTPHYMSPEQASAKKLDHRTDLYSLGIILYEILAGSPPFKGDSAIAVGVMHITQPVPELPKEFAHFQNFIDTALAKDPDDRYQSGDEFIRVLSTISLVGDNEGEEDGEFSTTVISQADIEEALGTAGFGSGFHEEEEEEENTDEYDLNNMVPESSSSVPFLIPLLILALIGGGYYYYTSVLGNKINWPAYSQKLLGSNSSVSGFTSNLTGTIGNLSDQVFQKNGASSGLSRDEQRLLKSYTAAVQAGRLFSPSFDSAEHYLKEMYTLNPKSKLAALKYRELLILSINKSTRLLEANQTDKAFKLISRSKRILAYVNDKQLRLKHRQLTSTILIARE